MEELSDKVEKLKPKIIKGVSLKNKYDIATDLTFGKLFCGNDECGCHMTDYCGDCDYTGCPEYTCGSDCDDCSKNCNCDDDADI